jgi:flavin reductase (DIM6/NTAB) family NADH-FMN oxidoreductase RutF
MKHFLKPFTPGEDRFAHIETTKAENSAPILAEALAYLECRVGQRMECGDHRKFGSETPSFYDGFTVKYEHRLRNIC